MSLTIIHRVAVILLLLASSASAQSLGTCVSSVGTGSQAVTITTTSGQGIVVFYKGINSDPGLNDPTNGVNKDSQGNNYTVIASVASGAGNCENARYSTTSTSGSDTLTAPGPGASLNNFITACPVNSFAIIDKANGMPYTSSTNCQTGSVTPTNSSELAIGHCYDEANVTPTGSGSWSDYVDAGSPSAIAAVTASTSTQLTEGGTESTTGGTATGLQKSFTTSAATAATGGSALGMW